MVIYRSIFENYKQKFLIMKTVLKSKIMLALLFTGLLFSCKNNSANTQGEGYNSNLDSTETLVDTTSMYTDSTNVNGTNDVNGAGNNSGETNGMGTNGSGANGAGTGGTGTNGTGSGGTNNGNSGSGSGR